MTKSFAACVLALLLVAPLALTSCNTVADKPASPDDPAPLTDATSAKEPSHQAPATDASTTETGASTTDTGASATATDTSATETGASTSSNASTSEQKPIPAPAAKPSAEELRAALNLTEDYRDELEHGPKDAAHQRWIVLHDTEGAGNAANVIDAWVSAGRHVAAHFIVNKDGSIWQCVPLDKIAHHAGYGDTGHNAQFGVEEDGRDDMVGATPIGNWASDYGMNGWSVGIELVHMSTTGEAYPEEQLDALDHLIAYIDAYYGFESKICDHKAWRSYNSDTSAEFATYLANYQDHRTHL